MKGTVVPHRRCLSFICLWALVLSLALGLAAPGNILAQATKADDARERPAIPRVRKAPPTVKRVAPRVNRVARPAPTPKGKVSLMFKDVDLRVLIQFIAKLTGKNYVVSDKVSGRVTIISPQPVSIDQALAIFQSVLEVNDYTTIEHGDIVKVVPIKDARRSGLTVYRADRRPDARSEEMVTQLVSLRHSQANQLRALLVPLVSRYGHVTAHQESNSLVITDRASNVRRLVKIAESLDAPGAGNVIDIVKLKHGQAADIATALGKLFAKRQVATRTKRAPISLAGQSELKALAEERTNSIILLGSRADIVRAKEIIARLDQPEPEGRFNIHVIHLRHAVAEDLADVLGKLSGGASGVSTAGPAKKTQAKEDKLRVISQDVKLVAEPATNSLIISASPPEFKVIKSIVAQLDIPRTMVYVEAVILEMTASKSLEFGINWHGVNDDGSGIVFGGVGGQVPDKSNPLKSSVPGFNFGVIGPSISFGGITIPNLSVLLKAVQTDSEIRVVATPQILTADNEEATIQVAENIPFMTRLDEGSSTTDRAIQTFEYRDVGYTLKVTPRIGEGQVIRLNVEAEHKAIVNAQVEDSSGNVLLTPTTSVRNAKTTIVTTDSEIVAIGGLIGNELESGGNQVPCLGSIPLLGWGFKSTTDKGKRTNMLIFLSPHILVSAIEARHLSERKMKESREGMTGRPEDLLTPLRPKTPDPAILERMKRTEED